jgi:hypothetical protein
MTERDVWTVVAGCRRDAPRAVAELARSLAPTRSAMSELLAGAAALVSSELQINGLCAVAGRVAQADPLAVLEAVSELRRRASLHPPFGLERRPMLGENPELTAHLQRTYMGAIAPLADLVADGQPFRPLSHWGLTEASIGGPGQDRQRAVAGRPLDEGRMLHVRVAAGAPEHAGEEFGILRLPGGAWVAAPLAEAISYLGTHPGLLRGTPDLASTAL